MIRLRQNIPLRVIKGEDQKVATWIDKMRNSENARSLIPLLSYDHAIYAQRSTNETIRIRGYLMAAFEATGLPQKGLGYFLEELDNAHNPYILAGAAIGLRGLRKPTPRIMTALLEAVQRLQYADDMVCFDQFKPDWRIRKGQPALVVLLHTIALFSNRLPISKKALQELTVEKRLPQNGLALCDYIVQQQKRFGKEHAIAEDCCGYPTVRRRKFLNAPLSFKNIQVEDHNGLSHRLVDLMRDKPTVLSFFYTRCDNAYRCSLTIARLGWLQKALQKEGIAKEVQLLAISFDGAFDLPYRMKAFSAYRGLQCNDHARCLRVPSGMEKLLGLLRPGVNFNNGLVNHHGVAFFVFDRFGYLKQRIPATQWNETALKDDLLALRNQKVTLARKAKNTIGPGLSVVYSVALAFFPKCPLCAAAYLSALGISSAGLLRYHRLLLPVLVLLFAWHLQAVARRAWQRNWYLPLVLSLGGAACVAWSAFGTPGSWWSYLGIFLIATGSLLNSWDPKPRQHKKRKYRIGRLRPLPLIQKR